VASTGRAVDHRLSRLLRSRNQKKPASKPPPGLHLIVTITESHHRSLSEGRFSRPTHDVSEGGRSGLDDHSTVHDPERLTVSVSGQSLEMAD